LEFIMKAILLERILTPWLRHSVFFTGLIIVTLSIMVPARAMDDLSAGLSGESLVEALRKGGFTIYFRHEATNWAQSDIVQKSGDWLSCDVARIRQLSSTGRQSAVATGEAMRKLGIPVSRVLASPYCRTVETASLMNLGEVEPTDAVINMRVAEYFGGRAAVVATARALLARLPQKNTNTVVVAHGNVALEATTVYPGEGEGIVFQAHGEGGFRFVGRLKPAHWNELAQSYKSE
jgi:hypothetical protein